MTEPLPEVMQNAEIDLTATIEGKFSPADWCKILQKARTELDRRELDSPFLGADKNWQEVVRDYYTHAYWGFKPNYHSAKIKRPKNLGLQFIWILFNTLTTMKVAVLWFGQIYSRSDEPSDKWIFLLLLVFIVGNFAYFLWRNQSHPDHAPVGPESAL